MKYRARSREISQFVPFTKYSHVTESRKFRRAKPVAIVLEGENAFKILPIDLLERQLGRLTCISEENIRIDVK